MEFEEAVVPESLAIAALVHLRFARLGLRSGSARHRDRDGSTGVAQRNVGPGNKTMAAKQAKGNTNGNGAHLGFEEKLRAAAETLRRHLVAAEYKHVVRGLVSLKYTSDAFQELHDALASDKNSDPEDRDEYLAEKRLLGSLRGPLGKAPVQCQAADDRQLDRRCAGRHREGQPDAEERRVEGLRPGVTRKVGSGYGNHA